MKKRNFLSTKKEMIDAYIIDQIIAKIIDDLSEDIIQHYDLSISSNYVEIDSITFDEDKVDEIVREAIREFIDVKKIDFKILEKNIKVKFAKNEKSNKNRC